MVSQEIVCWKCGVALADLILPMSRREECPSCAADQHVCMLCRSYDERVADRCTEERAEPVTNKESANFCDYFEPKPGAFQVSASRDTEATARAQLAGLFGDEPAEEELSRSNKGESEQLSEEDRARAELEKLFGADEG